MVTPTYSFLLSFSNQPKQCIIADFDADAVENKPIANQYGVSSYPTIKFFPKGDDKSPIDYNQGRSEADFVAFLNEHCGTYRAPGGGLNDVVRIGFSGFAGLSFLRADLWSDDRLVVLLHSTP